MQLKKSIFADLVNVPVIKTETPLVIKYKSDKTKADITKSIDPKSLKIAYVYCRNNNVVIDYCGDGERKGPKRFMENTMPKEVVPYNINPRFKLTDMNFNYGNK